LDSLGDWSVNIGIAWQVKAEEYDWLIEKQALERIYIQLPKNWIDFPFPTYDVNIKQNGNEKN
jgi:small-conductance mechanosensitive channel